MQRGKDFNTFSKVLIGIAAVQVFITVSVVECKLSETESFFDFINAVDPENVLRIDKNGSNLNPCSDKLKGGVKCNAYGATITELRLDSMNLSGTIDADSLCKLRNLKVLSLSKNFIRGSIPNSILHCRRLRYLNLSRNLLSGRLPMALNKLRYLRGIDISNNQFKQESIEPSASLKISTAVKAGDYIPSSPTEPSEPVSHHKTLYEDLTIFLPLIIGIVVLALLIHIKNKIAAKSAEDREILKELEKSPPQNPSKKDAEEEFRPHRSCSELVFFAEENERFKMEDLLEATADLQSHSLCSSLYKVMLKNNNVYAVKRMKKLQVSLEEFGQTMRQIGNLKHPNILPLIGYHSTDEEKLLIYKYQDNGSLLDLLDNYIEGKREFAWGLRLSIASGIARGLDFIYQSSGNQEIIPHGNLKLSNILLNENEEPLMSDYGFSRFLDPNRGCIFSINGYTAPEKALSEQADVFSFGVILLELLTGKTVERSGIDLPKWVRSMVREEWTGEVFDKEVNRYARQWAFPLLNVSLKCVSNSPEDRPSMAEVLEKIEEVVNDHDDVSISSISSFASSQQDCCLLHTVIPETWDTPGSNY
ncbi:hypothetical protein HS088_TW19G00092 [Tripterygium wilfordii]|uniref:Protein kinase domain-containing protein n=1 Tax=Tripterygium wilfordii TaxID=458696 RepID=A0A7J7C8M3_TRIWF|nr:probably inactive receptor-like protein kinase At5g41680 [Tripterygium wilfordii]KAF5730501.1 hypothetical protein HS088_TW19G00092 [Tripterygium wilfordii]